jgi:primosomal protein N' (replication factor Y)
MDMDTTRKKGEHERLYNLFKEEKADILIGTQMISKGMDFKNVTLVGVIAADTSLNLPDFRSTERTFQLITQVAGRAGRGKISGRVVVQTYNPEDYSIVCAGKHDYKGFYEREISLRKQLGNPPFSDILYILLASERDELGAFCDNLKLDLNSLKDTSNVEILGPSPCHISKIKKYYRWHIILKGDVQNCYGYVKDLISRKTAGQHINYYIDINPYNIF